MDAHKKLEGLIATRSMRCCFWGHLFSYIRRKPVNDLPSIMGVALESDGTFSLFYKPDLVEKTKESSLNIILEHEGLHLINMHIPRLLRILAVEMDDSEKVFKTKVWNLSSDCAVNSILRLSEIEIDNKKIQLQTPSLFNLEDNMASEYYYHELLKRKKDVQANFYDDISDGSGEGPQNGENSIDTHSKWDKIIGDSPDLYSLSRKAENSIKDLVKSTLKTFDRKRGTLPAYLNEILDGYFEPPQLPYYQIIRKFVRGSKHSKFKRSHTRINKKRSYLFALDADNTPKISPFPGRVRDFTFNISILIDTSGSMSIDDILEALSGTKDIIEKDKYCTINVVECDAEVGKTYQVKKIKDIQFNISGRGGTVLYPGLKKCKEFNSDITLVFTDGECDDINRIPRKLLPKKILWILNHDGIDDYINKTGIVVRLKK